MEGVFNQTLMLAAPSSNSLSRLKETLVLLKPPAHTLADPDTEMEISDEETLSVHSEVPLGVDILIIHPSIFYRFSISRSQGYWSQSQPTFRAGIGSTQYTNITEKSISLISIA